MTCEHEFVLEMYGARCQLCGLYLDSEDVTDKLCGYYEYKARVEKAEARIAELEAEQNKTTKTFCPNCEKDTECEFIAELYECKECGEMSKLKPCPFCGEDKDIVYDYYEISGPQELGEIVVCNNCGASCKPDVWNIRTIEDALQARITKLECENARLSEKLYDEISQLEIATDLGNKRWVVLNDIYENSEKHNANWCKRKAQEGLGIK